MTNAEKLSKDTDFLVNALIAYCGDGTGCSFCRFYDGKCCKICDDRRFGRDRKMKEWLESEVSEE